MGDKNFYRQDLFKMYLDEFAKLTPGVKAAALVTTEGFALATAGDTSDIENLDALSSLAVEVIKRAKVNLGIEADEIVIGAPDGDRVVCRYFEHVGETSGGYTLVIRCSREHDRIRVDALVANLREALQVFY
jgi:hypothetical protein